MSKRDPWTDPDPQPGDFDGELKDLDDLEIEVIPAGTPCRVTVVHDDGGQPAEPADSTDRR